MDKSKILPWLIIVCCTIGLFLIAFYGDTSMNITGHPTYDPTTPLNNSEKSNIYSSKIIINSTQLIYCWGTNDRSQTWCIVEME